jgi:multidrug efflux pump subunit AcrA (membrane-fusion protein)
MIEQKQILNNLQAEKASLSSNLKRAIDEGDGQEISKLKQREQTIDSDLFSAKALLLKAKIAELEAKQALNFERLAQAKLDTKECDALASVQITTLREEITRLSDLSFKKLNAVKLTENEIREIGFHISEAKRELENLLNN